MKSIQIRNVPEKTHAAIKQRAKANGRSMQSELREILASVAAQSKRPKGVVPGWHIVDAGTSGTFDREEIYRDD